MKKSKFIVLSVVLAAVVILSVSKINLAVENTQYSFNYPYLVYSQDKNGLHPYSVWFPDYINLEWDTKQFITPNEDMISYQQAANLAGEALKNIYGLEEHTCANGVIQLYNHVVYNTRPTDEELVITKHNTGYSQPHRYVYRFLDSNNAHYYAMVDRYNGTVFRIGINSISFVAGEEASATDEEIQRLETMVKKYIDCLGINAEIKDMDIKHGVNITGLNYYTVDAFLSDGSVAVVSIHKPYGEAYCLTGLSLNSPLNQD